METMVNGQLELPIEDDRSRLLRAWNRVLRMLEPRLSRHIFETYLKPIKPVDIHNDVVTLGANSPFFKEWIENKYSHLIRSAFETVLGSEVRIELVLLSAEEEKALQPPPEAPRARPASSIPTESHFLPLNEKYTFENFIVGTCNRLAEAGARSVADHPAQAYNPLFIHGGPGLGKTHLMHAIGHHILARSSSTRIAYMSGETFTHHYVSSMRDHKTEEFRRRYRSIDIWLVDDIQFIADKERTKEEFFHTFNALYHTNKQIIISSDRSPRELRLMDDRLKSRFECGLIADIGPPELETRIAILQKKAEMEKIFVPDDVLYYMASLIQSNIRALEGALLRLAIYASVNKLRISTALASDVLERYYIDRKSSEMTPDTIQKAVSEKFGVEIEAMTGKRRDRDVVLARQVAMYLMRETLETSLPEIGLLFGGRDHTTVLHACDRVKVLMKTDAAIEESVRELMMKLRSKSE
ncbi:MAG: chromosomal replication initiator protein DnaA [Armatimonadetes bacterium]|nr:chromosomal replication initiator protein DnaA [Armatimonadota bacterium]